MLQPVRDVNNILNLFILHRYEDILAENRHGSAQLLMGQILSASTFWVLSTFQTKAEGMKLKQTIASNEDDLHSKMTSKMKHSVTLIENIKTTSNGNDLKP